MALVLISLCQCPRFSVASSAWPISSEGVPFQETRGQRGNFADRVLSDAKSRQWRAKASVSNASVPPRSEVTTWKNVTITCKGQVFNGTNFPLVGCAFAGCGETFLGCGFSGGVCVWDSDAGRLTRTPYCAGGFCYPHSPGPGEKNQRDCRENAEVCAISHPEIVGGPVETVVVLTQPQWGDYYHFLIDGFTRLAWMYKSFPEVVRNKSTLFHTGSTKEAAQAWARLLGIDTARGANNKLIDGVWRAKVAYFPPANPCANLGQGPQLQAVQWLRASVLSDITFKDALPFPTRAKPLILMLKRDERKGMARSIRNFDDALSTTRIIANDWDVKVFSDYPAVPPVHEVCAMFARATLIIGTHGAGLANLVCAREGATLLEFQQEGHSADYELLSLKLGIEYVGMKTNLPHDSWGNLDMNDFGQALLFVLRRIRKRSNSTQAGPNPQRSEGWRNAQPNSSAERESIQRVISAPEAPAPASSVVQGKPSRHEIKKARQQPSSVTNDIHSKWSIAQPAASSSKTPRLRNDAERAVRVFHGAAVTCEGQVSVRGQNVKQLDAAGRGCDTVPRACVWNSAANIAKTGSYCLFKRGCVPNSPGPSNSSSEACQLDPFSYPECLDAEDVFPNTLDAIVVLTQPRRENWYRAIIGGLSRITWMFQQYPAVLRSNQSFFHVGFVTEETQAWARLAGINTASGENNRLIDGCWRAKVLYLPPENLCAVENRPVEVDSESVQWFRRTLFHGGRVASDLPVSRSALVLAATDPITNQTKHASQSVADKLVAMGWKADIIDASSQDIAGLCLKFYKASLIVALRSAYLVSMVCAREATVVVELQMEKPTVHFEALAKSLSLSYSGMVSETGRADEEPANLALIAEIVRPLSGNTGGTSGSMLPGTDQLLDAVDDVALVEIITGCVVFVCILLACKRKTIRRSTYWLDGAVVGKPSS